MAANSWRGINTGRLPMLNGVFGAGSWKCALFASTSNIGDASTTYAGVTNEIAAGNGYSTGGVAVTISLPGTTEISVDIPDDIVFTASGGAFPSARFAVVYKVGGDVMAYCTLNDLGGTPTDVVVRDGCTLTIKMRHTTAGVLFRFG